ncbi:hypothetical protein [Pseudomonas sp. IT-P4]|uniref:hypothetical protein n=1 Tax=Pseudomonas sp. IT-P4 TaxID=3026446 RepID=UPI0039DFD691
MPAPEDLIAKTPGEPLATITPLDSAAAGTTGAGDPPKDDAAPVLYVAKHSAGGRWHVVTNDAEAARVGDFVGDKVTIIAEVERMNAGGEPFVQAPKDDAAAKPQVQAARPKASQAIDAATLKQPVMTPDGWLCPEPPVKE